MPRIAVESVRRGFREFVIAPSPLYIPPFNGSLVTGASQIGLWWRTARSLFGVYLPESGLLLGSEGNRSDKRVRVLVLFIVMGGSSAI